SQRASFFRRVAHAFSAAARPFSPFGMMYPPLVDPVPIILRVGEVVKQILAARCHGSLPWGAASGRLPWNAPYRCGLLGLLTGSCRVDERLYHLRNLLGGRGWSELQQSRLSLLLDLRVVRHRPGLLECLFQ